MTVDVVTIKFHPAAEFFPPMAGAEFDELVADIKANGLKESIVLYDGKLLDGRNRARACKALGIPVTVQEHHEGCANIGDPFAYVVSKNFHRRHLTPEQKRDVLVKLVAAQPTKSDRTLAREAKVDHHQVSRARKKAEATGTIVPVEKRTGADGKARKQPARKGWSPECYKQHRAKRRGLNSEREKATKERLAREDYFEQTEAEAKHLAVKLVALDRDLARDLREILCIGGELQVMDALGHLLGSEGNGTAAEASADKLDEGVHGAAVPDDDGSDPGPIPACLRRELKATAP
jgi:ParB-like chromosome segregation protein Spo0J